MKNQEIRTNPDQGDFDQWDYGFWGRFKGRKSTFVVRSYKTGRVLASLSGYKLYRFAKAIVDRYENSSK